MAELLVLASFDGGTQPELEPRLGTVGDGFIGASLWVGVGEEETSLGVLHFVDETAGTAHLRERVEATETLPPTLPASVRHLRLDHRHGQRLEGSAVGGYLTTLHILASPGYGEEAGARLDEGLESIEPLEGYAGHLRGVNAALEDEVWALVLWTSPPVLKQPPEEQGASVAHYRRVR